MTLEELKGLEKTNETRWAIHLLETMEEKQLKKIMEICEKVLTNNKN